MVGIRINATFVVFCVVLILAFIITRPLLNSILAAVILAYIFYPLYSKLNSKIRKKSISALIITFLIIVLITLPTGFILNALSREVWAGYIITKQRLAGSNILGVSECEGNNFICSMSQEFVINTRLKMQLESFVGKAADSLTQNLSNILFSLSTGILYLFVTIFITYYLFKDGKAFAEKVQRLLPVKKEHQKSVISRLSEVTYAVVYGNIIVAFIQGIVAGIGFYVFGVSSPITWALVTMVVALIPLVGAVVIWLPASLFLLVTGYLDGSGSTILKGILLFFYGLFLISSIDNVLKPKIIGARASVHPVFILLGVVGGLKAFGIVGVILGPVILAVLVTFTETICRNKPNALYK